MINCCSEKCIENLLLQSGGIIRGFGITKRVLAKPQYMFRCGTINYFPQDVWYMKNSQTLQFLFKNFIEIKSNNCFKTKHLYIHMYHDGIYQFLNKMKIIKIKYLVDDINQTIKDLNLKKSIIIYTICTIHKKNSMNSNTFHNKKIYYSISTSVSLNGMTACIFFKQSWAEKFVWG